MESLELFFEVRDAVILLGFGRFLARLSTPQGHAVQGRRRGDGSRTEHVEGRVSVLGRRRKRSAWIPQEQDGRAFVA